MSQHRRHLVHFLAVSLALFALPAMLVAGGNTAILGSEGKLYRVLDGRYDALFENGTQAPTDHHVLALEITWPDQVSERQLIPGTEGSAVETSPSLSLDRSSDTLFVTWEATRTIHSELFVATRASGEWSELLEFSGNPFTTKANPQLSATHESFLEFDGEEGVSQVSQTILNLTWWDEQGDLGRILWAPLVLGADGLIPIAPIDLGSYIDEELPAREGPSNPSLARRPYIQSGLDQGHVIFSFIEPVSGRLVTLSVLLSGAAIDSIADEARGQIIIIGSESTSRSELAEALRQQLKSSATMLISATLADYLAEKAADAVLNAPSNANLQSIAEEARGQLIIVGARFRGSMTTVTDEARGQIIIIGANHPGMNHGRSMTITLLSHRPAPDVPEDAEAQIMVSPDGRTTIIAWQDDDSLRYVESADEGWGEPRALFLGGDLTADQALAILKRRLDS